MRKVNKVELIKPKNANHRKKRAEDRSVFSYQPAQALGESAEDSKRLTPKAASRCRKAFHRHRIRERGGKKERGFYGF